MAESLITTTLRERLIAVFQDPAYRPPPLPDVAFELLMLSGRSNARADEVVRLLEQDEMLAGGVLRLVGSSAYATRAPVRSLHDAVLRLGFNTVRDLVFEAALSRGVFDVAEYRETIEQVRRHSTVTAYIARIICQRAGVPGGDQAFICGLLHDIGFAGLLFSVTHFEGVGSPPLEQLWPEVDALHERSSALLTELWRFPASMREVVGHHHHLHTGPHSKVAAAICVADYMSGFFGADVVGPVTAEGAPIPADVVSDLDVELARSELGLDEALYGRVFQEAEAMVPEILWL